ncbi:MAG: phosphonate ABC transporter, permease protein PhnE, partial [Gammaproteobacteria bacterium]|nr:phosphonate ABC transporter, permease protein PhnE [Gammaproteobacteria bacterium]
MNNSAETYPGVWRRPSMIENPWIRHGFTFLALAYLFWSIGSLEIDWERVSKGLPRAANIFERMFPPDFSRWDLLVRGMIESLEMAFAATIIGMFLAIPLGLCAASNLVPRPVYLVARSIIVLTRTFHEVIIAIFFVKIFGFGPLAGVLTLVVASVSFIAKMLAEDIENMNP